MKKLLSLLLAVVLFCSLSIGVFAAEGKDMLTLKSALALEAKDVATIGFAKGNKAYDTEEASVIALFFEFADKITLKETENATEQEVRYVVSIATKAGEQSTLSIAADGSITIEKGDKKAAYLPQEAQTLLDLMQIFMPEDSVVITVSEWSRDVVSRAFSEGFIPVTLTLTDYTRPITREAFCELAMAVLLKSGQMLLVADGQAPFSDTDNEVVTALYNLGIIKGKSETEFAPDATLTREEAATILYRMATALKKSLPQSVYSEELPYYEDKATISDWAFDAVFVMREMGVMRGVSDTEFAPRMTYTAEQAVATMLRLFDASVVTE